MNEVFVPSVEEGSVPAIQKLSVIVMMDAFDAEMATNLEVYMLKCGGAGGDSRKQPSQLFQQVVLAEIAAGLPASFSESPLLASHP